MRSYAIKKRKNGETVCVILADSDLQAIVKFRIWVQSNVPGWERNFSISNYYAEAADAFA